MALTQEQRDAIDETIRQLELEVGGIVSAREDVYAALRLDIVDDPNIEALNVIQNAKARAAGHATTLATLLAP
jgi:hypothetical protein